MTAVALIRAPFRPLEVSESWDTTLLAEAAKLVGYQPTALIKASEIRKRSLEENIFARALERVDIQPFTIQSVEAYMARMAKAAHRKESWALTRYMHSSGHHRLEGGERLVTVLGFPTWIAFAITTLISSGVWHDTGHFGYVPYISGLPVLSAVTWGFLMYLRHKKAIEVEARWDDNDVQSYRRAIPAFAVQRMLSLKKELPEVTFSVKELNVTSREMKTERRLPPPLPDPFLVATFRGISAYVDVWDEPKFEGRRTV